MLRREDNFLFHYSRDIRTIAFKAKWLKHKLAFLLVVKNIQGTRMQEGGVSKEQEFGK